jgi:hypothetical protein
MDQIINNLLQIEQQLRIFHWQTKSYARHQAFGGAYDALGDLIDRFVEVYMGKNGRFTLRHGGIELVNLSEASTSEFVNAAVSTLTELSEVLTDKDGDLLNIKDEMLAELNKLKYLLTLQ